MARKKYSRYTANPTALADAVVNAYEQFANNPARLNEAVQKYMQNVKNANFNMMEQKLAMWYRALDEANISGQFSSAMTQAKTIYRRELSGMSYNAPVQGGAVMVRPINA